jgi:hypothetical protein
VGAMAHLALRRARTRSRLLVPVLVREARREDQDPARRLQLLDLIAKLAPPEIVRAELRRAAADPDEGVRRSAAAKLEAMGLGAEAASDPE